MIEIKIDPDNPEEGMKKFEEAVFNAFKKNYLDNLRKNKKEEDTK